jgi:hypothetical protein
MLGFNGGLLGKRRVPTVGVASGLWLPNEQSVARRDGIWPEFVIGYRYWRFDQFTTTSAGVLEIGEFALVNGSGYLSGNTWYNSGVMYEVPTGNTTIAALTNGVYNARAFQLLDTVSPAAYLQYDHGSAISPLGFKYSSFFRPVERHITGVRVSASNDGTNFTVVKTFGGLTAYTANNASSVNELSPIYSF